MPGAACCAPTKARLGARSLRCIQIGLFRRYRRRFAVWKVRRLLTKTRCLRQVRGFRVRWRERGLSIRRAEYLQKSTRRLAGLGRRDARARAAMKLLPRIRVPD